MKNRMKLLLNCMLVMCLCLIFFSGCTWKKKPQRSLSAAEDVLFSAKWQDDRLFAVFRCEKGEETNTIFRYTYIEENKKLIHTDRYEYNKIEYKSDENKIIFKNTEYPGTYWVFTFKYKDGSTEIQSVIFKNMTTTGVIEYTKKQLL